MASKAINLDGADGLLFGGSSFFVAQILGVLVVGIYTFVVTWVLPKIADVVFGPRIEPEEVAGLDVTEHSETVYYL